MIRIIHKELEDATFKDFNGGELFSFRNDEDAPYTSTSKDVFLNTEEDFFVELFEGVVFNKDDFRDCPLVEKNGLLTVEKC